MKAIIITLFATSLMTGCLFSKKEEAPSEAPAVETVPAEAPAGEAPAAEPAPAE